MPVNVEIKRAIAEELAWFSKAFHLTSDERVSWPGGEIDAHIFQLIASLNFIPRIPEEEKDRALWTTLNRCAKATKFTEQAFIRFLREAVDDLASKPVSQFSIVAQLNVRHDTESPFPIRAYGKPPVYIKHDFPRHERRWLEAEHAFKIRKSQFEDDFCFLHTVVEARNGRAALGGAVSEFQFFLGLLNLASRAYGPCLRLGIPYAPMGGYLLASPAFLVDRKAKKMGNWIHGVMYPREHKFHFTRKQNEFDEAFPLTRRWLRRIRATDFSDRLKAAIILFQDGLSASEIDVALIKLWTCIELLTSRPNTKEILDKSIKRASSIFSRPDVTQTRLEFIAKSRHSLVHGGEEGGHALSCAQWASIYAAELLAFFLFNKHSLRKHNDILDYLDAPFDADRLKREIWIRRLRLNATRTTPSQE